MKTKYFKQGGTNGQPITGIYKLQEGSGLGYLFGENVGLLELKRGDQIFNVIEISEKEFNNHYASWMILMSYSSNLTVYSPQKPEQEAQCCQQQRPVFRTRYTMIAGDLVLTGYSKRGKSELCKFIQDAQQFVVLNEKGEADALIKKDIIDAASFVFVEL